MPRLAPPTVRRAPGVALAALLPIAACGGPPDDGLERHGADTVLELEPGPIPEDADPPPSWPLTWVALPGGTFAMGSEEGRDNEGPLHTVTVAPFEITRTEITVDQWARCVEAGVCHWETETHDRPVGHQETCNAADATGLKPGREGHPMNCVSWDQARVFADWIGARLPTEAEWEYAARGGGLKRTYPWGEETASCQRAVMAEGPSTACGRNGTWPVCSKPAGHTPQGLCDMAGNVWEWVEDDWHPTYIGAPTDGSAFVEEQRPPTRVIRGGGFSYDPPEQRTTQRSARRAGDRGDDRGFRLVRSLATTGEPAGEDPAAGEAPPAPTRPPPGEPAGTPPTR